MPDATLDFALRYVTVPRHFDDAALISLRQSPPHRRLYQCNLMGKRAAGWRHI